MQLQVPQQNSTTGTRTRVARVRAEYPNQLDYSGSVLQALAGVSFPSRQPWSCVAVGRYVRQVRNRMPEARMGQKDKPFVCQRVRQPIGKVHPARIELATFSVLG